MRLKAEGTVSTGGNPVPAMQELDTAVDRLLTRMAGS